jgi:hypothetical protein
MAGRTESSPIRKRVWVQNVAVRATVLEVRLAAIAARADLTPEQRKTVQGAATLIGLAKDAAFRENPIPGRWAIWWRGTLIEAAYRNLHAAEVLVVGLYDRNQLLAEIPGAVARADAGLERNDPRRPGSLELLTVAPETDLDLLRERLRKVIEVGYAHSDELHARLRSFRNLVLGATAAISVFMVGFMVVVSLNPGWVPLCFRPGLERQVCPTGSTAGSGVDVPTASDVWILGLLGVLGGTLAAAVSISRLRGSATPYNVPTALALLKVPFGALTAIGSIIVIRGGFVPGLSALDSQVQILAYAVLFGYGQQLLTGIIDRQARSVLRGLPTKESVDPRHDVFMPVPPGPSQVRPAV